VLLAADMKNPSPADIAEMKARGYEPATIEAAEQQARHWAKGQEVIRVIEAAFANVKLGHGIGLMEAQGLDDYDDATTRAQYRSGDEKEDWRKIPADLLNRCNSSLSFFDAEGMRFHLPAYLLADLRGEYDFGLSFCLTHLSDYSKSQFNLLSPAQHRAIRLYLLHLTGDPNREYDQPDILRALDSYWTESAPEHSTP
jgi:hypothetical protein